MPSLAATFAQCTQKRFQLCGGNSNADIINDNSRTRSVSESQEQHEPSTKCNPIFRAVIENQTKFQWIYAQYLKLMALFIMAVSHMLYMSAFLNTFSALMDYGDIVDIKATQTQSYPLRHQLDILADYRKNMWMTVGSMCVALSTSCFFLLLKTSPQKCAYISTVRVIDLIAFTTLPALLFARSMLIENVEMHLPVVLAQLQKIQPATHVAASLDCSFTTVTDDVRCCRLRLFSF
ncbi:unnamed protein product [Anisakis simplex]|uniref:Uncharacterized protein n=1 Tax=Anisakis simplex TaxID=6269 RepID=A0A0M3J1J7_ANISI|nr:unnamed protein product [Anisakis simplex]